MFDCKVDGDKDFVLAAPTIVDHLCDPCAEHFAAVRAGLDAAGVEYVLDPRLVRGLDYYTRTTFEWISGVLAANKAGTVNAGGRYDGLAEALGGAATPGVGFAMGLDRVLLAMEEEGVLVPPTRAPRCFVVAIGDDARARGRPTRRRASGGGRVDRAPAFEERPLKAQLKMADRAGAEFSAIIGERELAGGLVTLRRFADGVQKAVPIGEVVSWLTRLEDWPREGVTA